MTDRAALAAAGAEAAELPKLRRQRNFAVLWTASTVSEMGTAVSELALPLVAIVSLGASTIAVGLLSTAEFAPYLLLSLPAGAWIDRVRRRRVLVGCDLVRFAAMASVPVAWWTGYLTMAQLYLVGVVVAGMTILFDLAWQAWLPELVNRAQLVGANAALQVGEQTSAVAGPGAGGLLVARLGAPVAVLADAVSYLFSAALVVRIRGEDRPAERQFGTARGPRAMLADIREGLAFVASHPVLRSLAAASAIGSLFGRAVYAVLLVHLVRDAGMGAATIGLVLSLGSVGFVAGAIAADRIVARAGVGRSLIGATLVIPTGILLLALTIGDFAAPLTVIGFGIYGLAAVVFTVCSLSVRQTSAPKALLGRVNATMRFLAWGTLPLAGVLGGALGSAVGLTPAMVALAACGFTQLVPMLDGCVRNVARLAGATSD